MHTLTPNKYGRILALLSLFIFLAPINVSAQEKKTANQLQKELDAAERNFFDAFNEVNDVKDFNVKCDYHKPVGSRRRVQICSPRFVLRNQANRSVDFVSQGRWDSPSPAGSRMAQQKDELRAQMAKLVNADENLQRVFAEFAAARRALQEAR